MKKNTKHTKHTKHTKYTRKLKGGFIELNEGRIEQLTQIYDTLIIDDKSGDIKKIRQTENLLLATFLAIKHITVQQYITGLKQKFADNFDASITDFSKIREKIPLYTLDDNQDKFLEPKLYVTKKNVENSISVLSKKVLEVSAPFTEYYYSNKKEELNLLFLKLSQLLKNFMCIKSATDNPRNNLIIHYLHLRLIAILNRDLFLYCYLPTFFYLFIKNAGGCFDKPIEFSVKNMFKSKASIDMTLLDKQREIYGSMFLSIYELQSETFISENEVSKFVINSQKPISGDLYGTIKSVINYGLIAASSLGMLPFAWIMATVNSSFGFIDFLVTNNDEERWRVSKDIQAITSYYFTQPNDKSNILTEQIKDKIPAAILNKSSSKGTISMLGKKDESAVCIEYNPTKLRKLIKEEFKPDTVAAMYPQSTVEIQQAEWNNEHVKKIKSLEANNQNSNIRKIKLLIEEYKKLPFEYYDKYYFQCYLFKEIIEWKCKVAAISKQEFIVNTDSDELPMITSKEETQNEQINAQQNSTSPMSNEELLEKAGMILSYALSESPIDKKSCVEIIKKKIQPILTDHFKLEYCNRLKEDYTVDVLRKIRDVIIDNSIDLNSKLDNLRTLVCGTIGTTQKQIIQPAGGSFVKKLRGKKTHRKRIYRKKTHRRR